MCVDQVETLACMTTIMAMSPTNHTYTGRKLAFISRIEFLWIANQPRKLQKVDPSKISSYMVSNLLKSLYMHVEQYRMFTRLHQQCL